MSDIDIDFADRDVILEKLNQPRQQNLIQVKNITLVFTLLRFLNLDNLAQ